MTGHRRYLVTGLQGQVVQSILERAAAGGGAEIIAIGRPDMDLTQPDTIASAIDRVEPDLIISAAAYTAVDQAESDEEAARLVNAVAAGEIARIAALRGTPLIHLSTDYVFDGTAAHPYGEADPVAPLGAYGRTKLEGERRIQEAWDNSVILRTAWVYSPFGRNFVKTMLRLAQSREELGVVSDQIGNPTSALDIADGILAVADGLLERRDPGLRGIFHMTGTGEASWADLAEAVFRFSAASGGPAARVNPIPASAYPTPARRPANSRLDCRRLEAVHGVRLPDWRQSAEQVVARLLENGSSGLL